MISALLELNFVIPLVLLALASPLVAYALINLRPGAIHKRQAIVLGLTGPFALVYWIFYNLVLSLFGFDSVVSVIIVLVIALGIGWFAGGWAGRAPAKR